MTSASFWPRFHLIVALLGVPLFVWAHQGQWGLADFPPAAAPDSLSFPVRVDGTEAGTPGELRFLVQRHPVGASIELAESGAPKRGVTLVPARTLPYRIITLASGLIFLAVCLFVLAPRTETVSTRDFFWCTYLYGLAVATDGVFFPRDPVWAFQIRAVVQLAALAILPPLFVHLTLEFPRRNRILDHAPWLLRGLWIVASGLVVWQALVLFRYFADPGPGPGAGLRWPKRLADLALVLQVALALGFLLHAWRTAESSRPRRQIKWLLWGFAIGVTPYVFLRTLPGLLGVIVPWDPAFDRVLELAIPVAFMGAVARHQFLDIDIIIRRSLLYAGVAATVLLGYVLVAGVLGQQVQGPPGARGWLLLCLGLAAGLAFHPLRRIIGRAVDRTLFGITLDRERAVLELRTRLERVDDQHALAQMLHAFVVEAIDPRECVVAIEDTGGWITVPGSDAARAALPGTPSDVDSAVARNAADSPEAEHGVVPPRAAAAGMVLVEPLRLEGSAAGLFLLGPKRNDRRYVDADLDLIRSAAVEGALALDRLRLVQAAAEEAAARHRLDELNRLKNEFLARVAHDLRTPLASITWSVDNLLDGVTGDLAPLQREYLDSVRASAGHLNRLITNLLEITRMEKDGMRVADDVLDLVAVCKRAAATAGPLAMEKRVRIEIESPPEGLPARGDADKLTEVALNLLDNAVKYAPADTVIQVSCRVTGGSPTITVRDRGVGLGGAQAASLFGRFAQGTPSTHSPKQGFGLGLYIVDSYVRLMGGEVHAADHPEGGAMFTCRLRPPESPAPAKERL